MKIGIFAGNTAPTGGGAHTLIDSIKRDVLAMPRGHEIVFFFADRDAPAQISKDSFCYVNFAEKRGFARLRTKCLRRLGLRSREWGLNECAKEEKVDLLWLLGPYEFFLEVPYIFTVWDLGHRVHPCFPELNNAGWTWEERERTYQNMLFKATYVITGNETGKREILENYPMSPDKIRIVPFPVPGFCFDQKAEIRAIPDLAEPFIFFPAQFWAHKNHIALIEAIRYLRDVRDFRIVCCFAGFDQGNLAFIERKIAEYCLGDRIRILGFVEQAELRFLYSRALAMVFVSLLGPNNLPPLEASAMGCPVIISDLPGHIEEMEGSALQVDATNYSALGEAIYALYADPGLRASYIAKGQALAERYRDYSYFGALCMVIDHFGGVRATWDT
jgi:glycosyltransferase involved in cell wall biosynthesis